MTLLLILFLIVLYFSLSASKKGNPRKKFIIIASFVMILLSGLRHEGVGNDTLATMFKFEETASFSWQEVLSDFWLKYTSPDKYIGKDPGESIFYKVLSLFTSDSRVFLFVVAIIVLTSFGFFVYRNTKSLRTILFSYIYYITLSYGYIPNSAFRQSMAFAILLPALMMLNNKKYVYFLLLLVIASIFHKSVLIAFVLLPLMFIRSVKEIYWLCLLPFLVFFFYYQPVGIFLAGFSDIYEGYSSANYYLNRSLPIMVILMVLGLYLYVGFSFKKEAIEEKNRLYIYGTALTLIFVPLIRLDPSALRLISYFAVLMGIQVGNTSSNSESLRTLYWIIIAIFVGKAALTPDDGYRFMWQQKKLHERYGKLQMPLKKNTKQEIIVLEIKSTEQNNSFIS